MRGNVHLDPRVLHKRGLGPLAVLPRHAQMAVNVREAEPELLPLDSFLRCFEHFIVAFLKIY